MQGMPESLDRLVTELARLPGIGPRNAQLFEKLCGGGRVLDVLFHMPIDFIDRRFAPKLKDAPPGRIATLTVTVEKHTPAPRRNLPHRVSCRDETGTLTLVFFNARRDYIEKQLPIGATVIVSGKVEYYQGNPQIIHPDAIGSEEERAAIETIEPVYPLTAVMIRARTA